MKMQRDKVRMVGLGAARKLIINKESTGRPKDRQDAEDLKRS
jgi:hypothetical protein